jgi:hypothetical protein
VIKTIILKTLEAEMKDLEKIYLCWWRKLRLLRVTDNLFVTFGIWL